MLSIIICSISPERLHNLKQNIQSTIGTEYEVISVDNREKKWPIAKVYNSGAQKAKYPYLFFVHEDVMFHSTNWGGFVEQKLIEPDCGAIGFAGGKIMLGCYSGWNQYYAWVCCHLYQNDNGLSRFDVFNTYLEHPFEEVVTLDGLGIFVRKEIWEKYPFDEELLTGFHCYDIDFSLQIAATKYYKNYVCCSNHVLIQHFSQGSYNTQWFADTVRLYKSKWAKMLPIMVDGWELSLKERKKYEEKISYEFIKKIYKSSSCLKGLVLRDFWLRPFSWKHFRHSITCTFKYLIKH